MGPRKKTGSTEKKKELSKGMAGDGQPQKYFFKTTLENIYLMF